MEKLKQYLTRKNMLLASFVNGIIGLLLLFIYFITINNSNFQSILSLLLTLCMLFYVDFVLLLLLTLGYGFLVFYVKQKDVTTYIMAGCTAGAFLMSLFSFSTVNAINQLLNGNFSAIWSLASSSAHVDKWLLLMLILQLVCGGLSGYLRFVKKTEELSQEDLAQFQDTAKQVGDAAAATAKKAASDVAEGTAKLSEKWKAYSQTEKGKKTIKLTATIGAVVIVVIIAVSIWSATRTTPIDLTSGCEVTFNGYDGEGYASIDCDIDYDLNNFNLQSFVNDVEYTIENDGSLSNGDKAVLKADYSEETARALKLSVENAQIEIEVEGLTEVYRTFADIPADVSDSFAQASKEALTASIIDGESWAFDPEDITINSCDIVGIYYEYNQYFGEGTAYYLYRVDFTEENEYRTENLINYYYVEISPISSEHPLDLTAESSDILVFEVYINDDEKTDAKAVENFKNRYSNVQTIEENLSDKAYKDTKTDKN